jgi:hypothetical protein
MCGKLKRLGKNASVLARIAYEFKNEEDEFILCDACIDVFADAIQEGSRVFQEAANWRVRSRVARISLVQDHLFCFKCLGRSDTHVFFKYDDLRVGGKESYQTMRVCSRCVVSYLTIMKELQCTLNNKYKVYVPSSVSEVMRMVPNNSHVGVLYNG